jgi:hypothetical protein
VPYTYYTESRIVPIFQTNPKTTQNPASVRLNPQAQVQSATDEDSYDLVQKPYVQVSVIGGVTPDPQPAWWPNGWVLRKFLRKGLKRNTASTLTNEQFTGVTYGDYKQKSDLASNQSARFVKEQEKEVFGGEVFGGMVVVKPGFTCQKCGRLSADHRVYETVALRQLATNILAARGTDSKPPMFGILDVRESNGTNRALVLAESGFNFYMATTVAGYNLPAPGHYVTQTDITAMNDTYLDCAGTAINVGGPKFLCAAPKLVQYYAHNLRGNYQHPVLYLSEIAGVTQGIYVADHTAESCDNCRNTVPPMLCGLTNLERQKGLDDRYPKRTRT